MTNWNINERIPLLQTLFKMPSSTSGSTSDVKIDFVDFKQRQFDTQVEEQQTNFCKTDFCDTPDNSIDENKQFQYPIFHKGDEIKASECIILLHGLNERSWEKYLPWGDYLANYTGKPVIMFPIAFHINRTPTSWHNPRSIMKWVLERNHRCGNPNNLTFANLALSDRLSQAPERFYTSGCETGLNIVQLINEIQSGNHPYFKENTKINFFAYSIGALLAQVLFLSNPQKLFSHSRLFMFCGGSIFNEMNGNSRYIMDETSFKQMLNYYQNNFLSQPLNPSDCFNRAFRSMIDKKEDTAYREGFFEQASDRIKVIALKKDFVIPTAGIRNALGETCAKKCLTELDYPFEYSHETPFPAGKNAPPEVNQMFNHVFSTAGDFLA